MKVVFTKGQILNLDESLNKEYLLTNGLGGYCSSTIIDCHTRKYHGLLAAFLPEQKRTYLLVSKLELSLIEGKKEFHLSTNKFPKISYSKGYKYIEKYEMTYIPTTTYKAWDMVFKKSLVQKILYYYDVILFLLKKLLP